MPVRIADLEPAPYRGLGLEARHATPYAFATDPLTGMSTSIVNSTPKNPIPRRRWRIAWLLGLGVLVNYFDRVNLSVSHAALYTPSASRPSPSAISPAPTTGPMPCASCQSACCWINSASAAWAASAPSSGASLPSALPSRRRSEASLPLDCLLGVGEAPTFPANAKAIGHWFPSRERSFATSIFDGAAKFASAIGVPLIGVLLLKVGWRWSFAATGLISFFYFLALLADLSRPAGRSEADHRGARLHRNRRPDLRRK